MGAFSVRGQDVPDLSGEEPGKLLVVQVVVAQVVRDQDADVSRVHRVEAAQELRGQAWRCGNRQA